jgi:hypothetical protein
LSHSFSSISSFRQATWVTLLVDVLRPFFSFVTFLVFFSSIYFTFYYTRLLDTVLLSTSTSSANMRSFTFTAALMAVVSVTSASPNMRVRQPQRWRQPTEEPTTTVTEQITATTTIKISRPTDLEGGEEPTTTVKATSTAFTTVTVDPMTPGDAEETTTVKATSTAFTTVTVDPVTPGDSEPTTFVTEKITATTTIVVTATPVPGSDEYDAGQENPAAEPTWRGRWPGRGRRPQPEEQ